DLGPALAATLARDLSPALARALRGDLAPALEETLTQRLARALARALDQELRPVLLGLSRQVAREVILGVDDGLVALDLVDEAHGGRSSLWVSFETGLDRGIKLGTILAWILAALALILAIWLWRTSRRVRELEARSQQSEAAFTDLVRAFRGGRSEKPWMADALAMVDEALRKAGAPPATPPDPPSPRRVTQRRAGRPQPPRAGWGRRWDARLASAHPTRAAPSRQPPRTPPNCPQCSGIDTTRAPPPTRSTSPRPGTP
ncbi:MAG TPA: hypothetical protein PKW35_17135, partial [Nannocystaceae bacterium]|nr:hypothetical protein [Nannocystaceae bacterium]